MAANSALTFINGAFAELGASAIQSLDEDSDKARRAKTSYPIVRNALLTSYPWHWTITRLRLNRSTDEPTNQYLYQYPLPGDMIGSGPRAVYDIAGGTIPRTSGWDVIGRNLETDFPQIYIEYQRDVDESVWPPSFGNLMVLELAARWAFSITDQQNTADYQWRKAREAATAAKAEDSQGKPTKRVRRFPLVDVRRAYGTGWSRV